MAAITRRKHLRHQSLARTRKVQAGADNALGYQYNNGGAFRAFINNRATVLATPARAIRDMIQNLGAYSIAQVAAFTAVTDFAAPVLPRMTGAPTLTVALIAAVTPGNVGFGSRTTAALTMEPRNAATGNVTFASSGGVSGTIVRASGSWTTDGFVTGDFITVRGSGYNDGVYLVDNAVTLTLTVTKRTDVAETPKAPVPMVAEVLTTGVNVTNYGVLTRASGSFVTDGFAAGDRVAFAGTGDGAVDSFETEITGVAALKVSLSNRIPSGYGYVTPGTASMTSTNVITRTTGSFATDGFIVGDTIVAGGTTGNVGVGALVRTVAALRITTGATLDSLNNPVRFAFEAPAASRTLSGPTNLTRGAGSWTTDGFVVNDLIRTLGLAVANNRDWRVQVVTSATVLRLNRNGSAVAVAEGPIAAANCYKLQERARD